MKKIIVNSYGKYKLCLVTKDYIYYVNEDECDENVSVIMMNKKGDLISDNYFAYGNYMSVLEEIIYKCREYEFIDSSTLELATKYFEN